MADTIGTTLVSIRTAPQNSRSPTTRNRYPWASRQSLYICPRPRIPNSPGTASRISAPLRLKERSPLGASSSILYSSLGFCGSRGIFL